MESGIAGMELGEGPRKMWVIVSAKPGQIFREKRNTFPLKAPGAAKDL